jgi:hypothetical protein
VITTAVLNFFQGIVTGLLSFLPASSGLGLASKASSIVSDGLFQHVGWLNDYVPVDQFLLALAVVLGTIGVMLSIRAALWFLRAVHVLSGSDG